MYNHITFDLEFLMHIFTMTLKMANSVNPGLLDLAFIWAGHNKSCVIEFIGNPDNL